MVATVLNTCAQNPAPLSTVLYRDKLIETNPRKHVSAKNMRLHPFSSCCLRMCQAPQVSNFTQQKIVVTQTWQKCCGNNCRCYVQALTHAVLSMAGGAIGVYRPHRGSHGHCHDLHHRRHCLSLASLSPGNMSVMPDPNGSE